MYMGIKKLQFILNSTKLQLKFSFFFGNATEGFLVLSITINRPNSLIKVF